VLIEKLEDDITFFPRKTDDMGGKQCIDENYSFTTLWVGSDYGVNYWWIV
jgi:hypothetical protein